MRIVIVLLSFSILYSCGNDNEPESIPGRGVEPIENQEITPFEVAGYYKSKWSKEWSKVVFDSLDEQKSELLNIHINMNQLEKLNCANFNSFSLKEKKKFWALFLSSVSHFESNFNPRTRYWEPSLEKYSEGLFQLSVDDSTRYKFCDLDSDNILSPSENIACATSILGKQVIGNSRRMSGVLFPSRYFYWSVLTRPRLVNKVTSFFKKRSALILPECFSSKVLN